MAKNYRGLDPVVKYKNKAEPKGPAFSIFYFILVKMCIRDRIIASVLLIFSKNLLPSPSPFEAPFTRPAMSTNSITAGVYFFGLYIWARKSSLESGTVKMCIRDRAYTGSVRHRLCTHGR